MDIFNTTGLAFGFIPGRVNFPGHSLTLIIKGTFDMSPAGAVTLADEQPVCDGSAPYQDDEEQLGAPRYESDFAHFKPKADVMLVGHCHPPQKPAKKARVTFTVGRFSRSLAVFGDRGAMDVTMPFSEMEIRYDKAKRSKRNPWGRKTGKPNIETLESQDPAGFGPLHHTFEPRATKLGSFGGSYLQQRWPWFPKDFDYGYYNAAPESQQVPYLAGDERLRFESLHPDHPIYETRLPGMRARCFVAERCGPPPPPLPAGPQRADLPRYPTTWPEHNFREVTMQLDTLWVDMDAEKLVLVWRGVTPVKNEELREIAGFFCDAEQLTQPPKTVEACEELFLAARRALYLPAEDERSDVDYAPPDIPDLKAEHEALLAEVAAEVKKYGKELGPIPQPTPESAALSREIAEKYGFAVPKDPLTRQQVITRAAGGRSFAGEDLSKLDLSRLGLADLDFSAADLTAANLTGTDLSGANLADAKLRGSNLTDANLSKANLASAILDDSTLTRVDLRQAQLKGAMLNRAKGEAPRFDGADLSETCAYGLELHAASFDQATLNEADLSDSVLSAAKFDHAEMNLAMLSRCHLAGASFVGTKAVRANFVAAHAPDSMFARADCTMADFSCADLTRADFCAAKVESMRTASVEAPSSNWSEADMFEFRSGAQANFTDSRFNEIRGADSIWDDTVLVRAVFASAHLERAIFNDANVDQAEFLGAHLQEAQFASASMRATRLTLSNCFRCRFDKADMTQADLTGASLFESEFIDAVSDRIVTTGANLKVTKLCQ